MVEVMGIKPYLFTKKTNKIQLVYAGAMLPKAFAPLERIFAAVKANPAIFDNLEIHFIGSGTSPNNREGYNVKRFAEKYGLWETVIFEYPIRIPYIDVLVHLNASTGVFILGSTEPHYTPSKVYQGVLSKKPIWAVLHKESTGCKVIRKTGAGIVLDFNGENELEMISNSFSKSYLQYLSFIENYNFENIEQVEFEKYSAFNITRILAENLNRVGSKSNRIISKNTPAAHLN